MDQSSKITSVRVVWILAIIALLFASIFFSISSFTGYIINEIIDPQSNFFAAALFLIGVIGALLYLKSK